MRVKDLFSLKKKNIIITGGNSGIGLEISRSLIQLKVNLIRVDLNFNKKIGSKDYICDLRKINDIKDLFKKIKERYKRVDGLVNCAGVSINSKNPYEDLDYYNNTLDSNLKSAFFVTVATSKLMKKNGSVINITSLGSEQAFPKNPIYQVSKAGLKQLTKAFARDYSYLGIRFNNICPGYIKSKMTIKSYLNKKENKIRSSRTLLNSWGRTENLVGPVIFLLSEASSYITGSDIYVDGGWTAKGI